MRNKDLRQEFLKAACPTIDEFNAIYEVKMLTGFWMPPNAKVICEGRGFNMLLGDIEWGHFRLEYGMTQGMERAVVFDYAVPENVLTTRIRDYVRRRDDGSYLGAFNYVIFGKPRFAGYFSLSLVTRGDSAVEMA